MTADKQHEFGTLTRGDWERLLEAWSPDRDPYDDLGMRRQTERHSLWTGIAKLTNVGRNPRGNPWVCSVLDVSATGLMVKTQRRIGERGLVRIELALQEQTLLLRGQVVHCTKTLAGYKTGIRLEFPDG